LPHYPIFAPDRGDALDLRLALRQAHIAYLTRKPGVVKVAGAMLDGERPIGSSFLIEASGILAAKALMAGDPFTLAGIFNRQHRSADRSADKPASGRLKLRFIKVAWGSRQAQIGMRMNYLARQGWIRRARCA
jgi:uncharacterized protein YciI